MLSKSCLFGLLVAFIGACITQQANAESYYCSPTSRCGIEYLECPAECPSLSSEDPKAKVCYVNCNSPQCYSECKHRKANCDTPGSACFDPRFIGGDGVVFYFHGKSNQHFSLVSDSDLQINGRFIGHRPAGRSRDFTWIQALGVLFNSHSFSLEATKAATWDSQIDHLTFNYNGEELVVPEGSLSTWYSPEKDVKVERVSSKNSVIVTLKDAAEIMVNVVPVTKEDDRVHRYQLPSDNCFVHLEIQFRFLNLSPKVDGVLGRTYRPDFENQAKPGVAMPVLGGEDNYRIESLLSSNCKSCNFAPQQVTADKETSSSSGSNYITLDCTHNAAAGYGIVCKK
ncbi:Late embryogenesis abundant (LEA) protein-related [Euphorbia peplus]|nr:Late embryogenesis abundant (LEA) protein-related [Euphorbia peplus]